VVMRCLEVDVGIRLEDELLLVAIHHDGERAAVSLATLPGEELSAHPECGTRARGVNCFGEGKGELAYGLPVSHWGRVTLAHSSSRRPRPRPYGAAMRALERFSPIFPTERAPH
jgi:hypothetical protein